MHWEWDWDLHHDHHWMHWKRPWLWDSYYHLKCPTRRYYWPWLSGSVTDFDVCTRDWHFHHNDAAPWCHRSCLASNVTIETGDESDSSGKGTFKIIIDVHHFRSDELLVKVKNNDTIVLEGKQKDDRADKAALCVTREFTRKYKLPRNYDATLAKATLSTDGILKILVAAPAPLDDVERVIEIVSSGAYFGSSSKSATNNKKAIKDGSDVDEIVEMPEKQPQQNDDDAAQK